MESNDSEVNSPGQSWTGYAFVVSIMLSMTGLIMYLGGKSDSWLPTDEEREYVKSLMKPVYEVGQCAHWIAPPKRGINKQSFDFQYIRH